MLKLNGTLSWFKMKYVKLPDFCYACGMLGHIYHRCELYNPDVPESDLQYGLWLRATPIKKKARDHERKILQERHRLLGLQDGKQNSKAKMRLEFDKGGPTEMHIDKIPIEVGGDIAKSRGEQK